MKQLISIVILIIIIVGLNTITLLNTKKSIEVLNKDLYNLEENIDKENIDEINKNISNIENNWNKYKETLAFYIEHDELEKVETEIVAFKTNIETGEYETAREEISKAKFILEHIKEKNELKLKNIF